MTTLPDLNWDHLRVFLAVMRSNSLRQAAQQLGTSHPTIRRRLAALEAQVGIRLFDRRSDSLHVTPEAAALLEKAEQVEASIHAFERCASSADPSLQGTIHVTAPDLVMSDLLAPDLAAFAARWPQITLRIETSYELADLGRREADIAFRLVSPETVLNHELAGRKAATTYAAVYGRGRQWIGWPDRERQLQWIRKTPFRDYPIHCVLSNVYLMRAACIAGMGLAILPCFMAEPYLERRTQPEPGGDLWVLVHPDLRRNARLRLFRDQMFEAIKRREPQLKGTASNEPEVCEGS
ncbi:LysR family transcriptional regulator [Sulfidibacter corallicola]|uniref:LysR family transcriptional regulator n=1 Tax=Sulfidibacter corallicola TaxID=2818388 RepID=A0A8A4TIR5_SULCO|nr:LysR family transcriptional regulator [Sulfidibacter corallicola]QTD48688.1 LysR family transcriptional regulator [Sulfidibacter corallicola]